MDKTILKKKLVLGSVNFTQKYGVNPKQIKLSEIKKIFSLAKKKNVMIIDTAESYITKSNIFKNLNKKFQLITKIIPSSKWTSLSYCEERIKNHIKKYNNLKIKTLLFHDTKILFTKNGPKIFNNLEILKKKKFFSQIGISIYNIKELDYIIPKYDIKVVQCPYNLLDKRVINSGWYSKLKKRKIEIHVRSIFLKGLLVNEKIYKKLYFRRWNKQFSEWFKFLKKSNISAIDYCLSDLLTYDFDKIIIGINNCDHLIKIFNFKLIKSKSKIFNNKVNSIKLVDPRKWN